jgi:hypothetical protein
MPRTNKNKQHTSSAPSSRSYWVVPGKFLAGCYPGSENKDEAYKKLKGVLDHCIRHVINLMESHEFNWDMKPFVPYEDHIKSIAASMVVDVTIERIPMRDMRPSSRIEMIWILDRIDQSIEENKSVYIHCLPC